MCYKGKKKSVGGGKENKQVGGQPPPGARRAPLVYPEPAARYHGHGCAMELALLEKHSAHCKHIKTPSPVHNNKDNRAGSYYVVGRVVYEMCARPCGGGKRK